MHLVAPASAIIPRLKTPRFSLHTTPNRDEDQIKRPAGSMKSIT